ncbi:hypothetical protein H696_00756 [Fonticula alba]|uniref:CP-type G domain-containing protein n=1 Tax=Fonticula alba TaxID=691883 RepID=A0A058ZFS9_FONAL|nr:hypothetical protein H696_00756 [Fonticula alba]KCV73214.1 hypothetical protein H696_00756 [Fonticula alba]|eukprot:XP_009492915.1 hypothetical protein H696_00756 [Fonticula alba]
MSHRKLAQQSGLGRALRRDRGLNRRQVNGDPYLHSTEMDDGPNWMKMQSITDRGDLEEFLNVAQLADKEFTAERRNITVIMGDHRNMLESNLDDEALTHELVIRSKDELSVPRRPAWSRTMTREELDKMERDAFLEWRRSLASIQDTEKIHMTPFERNIEVWRQLWRVVDRSHVLVQIVDARNPELFRCPDLERYVLEVGASKKNLLLVNKSDLLTPEQRYAWAEYLDSKGIEFVFWSATEAQLLIDAELEALEQAGEADQHHDRPTVVAPSAADTAAVTQTPIDPDTLLKEAFGKPTNPDLAYRSRIVSRNELFAMFHELGSDVLTSGALGPDGRKQQLVVGLVGYPNVGKSSTTNVLCGKKRVAVAATPGKTKHFQTIILSPDLMICDCPGLVFPSFAALREDLVCNGILPIDQLREAISPTQLVCQRIPRLLIESIYGIVLPQPALGEPADRAPTATELLGAFAIARGFMRKGHGNADEMRAARVILKDYVAGKLLYAHPPPTIEGKLFNTASHLATIQDLQERKAHLFRHETKVSSDGQQTDVLVRRSARQQPQNSVQAEIDRDFFAQSNVGVGYKNKNLSSINKGHLEAQEPGLPGKKGHKSKKVKARNLYKATN